MCYPFLVAQYFFLLLASDEAKENPAPKWAEAKKSDEQGWILKIGKTVNFPHW